MIQILLYVVVAYLIVGCIVCLFSESRMDADAKAEFRSSLGAVLLVIFLWLPLGFIAVKIQRQLKNVPEEQRNSLKAIQDELEKMDKKS